MSETCELCGVDAVVPEACDNNGEPGYRCTSCDGWMLAEHAQIMRDLRADRDEHVRCYRLRDAVADAACKARDIETKRAHEAENRVDVLEQKLRVAIADFASIDTAIKHKSTEVSKMARAAIARVKENTTLEQAEPNPELLP